MKKISNLNPFRPGNGLIPPYLAGRNQDLLLFKKSLDIALSLPQNLVISGLRGTGKTVFLMNLEEICREKKWLFVRREFNRQFCNEQKFLYALLTDLVTKVEGASLVKKVRKKRIGFAVSDEDIINGDFADKLLSEYKGPLVDRMELILKELYSEINKAGFNGLVFLYDEFHFIEDNKVSDNFPLSLLLEAFSHVQQKGLRYYLVLSGLPTLTGNLVEAKTYAERMFQVRTFKELSPKDSVEAIKQPLRHTKFNFSEKLIDRLVKETGGYPYFIQFYCFHLIDNIPKKDINKNDFEKIYPFLLKQLDESFFYGRFTRLSNTEREILSKMLDLPEELEVSEIRKRIKKSRGAINLLLNNLVEKEILYRVKRGCYSFTLPMFKEFLVRNL